MFMRSSMASYASSMHQAYGDESIMPSIRSALRIIILRLPHEIVLTSSAEISMSAKLV